MLVAEKTLSDTKSSSLPIVLIVGGSIELGENLRLLLQAQQIRVLTVADGISALSLLSREEPALVLLKANMFALDGWQICRIIRKNLELKHFPILLLSEQGGIFSRLRARYVMASALYLEPQNITEWIQLIRKFV